MASCTLYGILARDGRSVVVFRRGPSRAVLLLRWWLGSDKIEEGQWFHGRIYEDRCDLSPDGEYLIYFAAKHGRGFGTWSAVSRPPYLTALALWPLGSTYGGGGIFLGPRWVALNHHSAYMTLAPGFNLPKSWRFESSSAAIKRSVSMRDEWEVVPGKAHHTKDGNPAWTILDPPWISRRLQPGHTNIALSVITDAIDVRNGPSRQQRAEVSNESGRILRRFDSPDWIEFSYEGDLLIGTAGCLYRLSARRVRRVSEHPLQGAKLVADLRPLVFRQRVAPPAATRW
jgi:hypothetical protein